MHLTKFYVGFGGLLVLLLLISQECLAKRRFCGQDLHNVLQRICVDGYKIPHIPKKRTGHYADTSIAPNDILPVPYDTLPKENIYAVDYNNITQTQRERRSYKESKDCCYRPCNLPQLKLYCL